MKGKTVSESTVFIVQQMIQTDANLAGNVHGGSIMRLIDSTAGIVAARHASCNVVTASIDRLDFHSPVYVGELLKLSANMNFVGTSSMEVGVRVEAENVITGHNRHTSSAYLTFVALDEHGKTKSVPPLVLKTDEEKRRNQDAIERRKIRLAERKRERKAHN
ncbi:MAG: acyl-CoA thioesterase [Bacillota bacterium]|nr:acyl-CoA thioesterase [Bacillota bacterium]